jgi:hypothetical protein
MKNLARFCRLRASDRRLLIEAALLLVAARAALKLLSFETIVRFLSRRPSAAAPDEGEARALVQRVRWAVTAGARHGPGRAVCFPQAIAAHLLLMRRGSSSTVYYGIAKTAAGELEAHVWVRAGSLAVVGCGAAPRFTVMTTFPRGIAVQQPSPQ